MKQSTKSKRVTWGPGAKLCQVRWFHRDASELNGGRQNTIQAKTSSTLHHSGNGLKHGIANITTINKTRPYGNGLKRHLANIPTIKWTRPPEFVLNFNWQVAAGEKSEEFLAQQWRVDRIRAVRAAYPCLSDVPLCPSDLRKLEKINDDDCPTPIVIPLEAADVSSPLAAQPKAPPNSDTTRLPMRPGYPSDAANGNVHSSEPENGSPKSPKTLSSKPVHINLNHSEKEFKPISSVLASWADIVSFSVRRPKRESSIPLCSTGINMPTSFPNPKPAKLSSSMLAHRYPNLFSPTILSMQASQADTGSISTPIKVELSVPLSGIGINNMFSGHGTANGDPYSTGNQVQPAHYMMPFQPGTIASTSELAVAGREAKPEKDTTYIRNLIKQHGRPKQEAKRRTISQAGSHFNQTRNLKLVQNLNLHGNSFHLQTNRMLEGPDAKRMKF